MSWHMDSTVLILESSRLWLRRHHTSDAPEERRPPHPPPLLLTRRGTPWGRRRWPRPGTRTGSSGQSRRWSTSPAWPGTGTEGVSRNLAPRGGSAGSGGGSLTSTVSSSAWILGSVRTSSSSSTLDSDTDTLRRCEFPILCVSAATRRFRARRREGRGKRGAEPHLSRSRSQPRGASWGAWSSLTPSPASLVLWSLI